MESLFPPEENFHLDIDALSAPDIRFFIARQDEILLGTAALALKDDYGEVKSMFVAVEARGKGVAAALMQRLEDEARQHDLTALRLETGDALTAAIRLYERHGFTHCSPFGEYEANSTSVFMEKTLG